MIEGNVEKRDIITLKKQIPFIQKCMEMFGYRTAKVQKVDQNWVITLEREQREYTDRQKQVEEKLRLIEITSRKKCGFNELFLNLFAHVVLFCIQGAILYRLNITTAHPRIMLEVGVLLFMMFLCVGFALKCNEVFRWNKLISHLKSEILGRESKQQSVKEQQEYRIISVLFTRNHGAISNLIYWVSGRQYTHASLGLGEQTEEFFSFDYRGLRREHPAHRKAYNNRRESLCYQFKVTPEEYDHLQNTIHEYLSVQPDYKYNLIGAIFSVFHIYMPLKSSKAYFCSEFVSQQLRSLDSFHLKKTS